MIIRQKEISNMLRNWDIGKIKTYKLLYSYWNISYKIIATKGNFILKILTMQTEGRLKRELKIMSLLKNKIPTRSLIKSKSGKDYLIIKGYPVLVAEFVEGKILKDGSQSSINILKQLGKYLALVHTTRFNGKNNTTNILEEINKIMYKMNKRSLEYDSLKKCETIIKQRDFDKQVFPKGLVHMDIHTENMIVKDDKILAILDFEDSNMNYFIYDIGLVILDTCFVKNKILSERRISAFLESYEEIRPMKAVEEKYIYEAILINWMRILYYTLIKNGINKDILKIKFMKDYYDRVNSLISHRKWRVAQ